jgi:CheY-like chemotaxis protein
VGAEDERALMEATGVRGGRVLVVDDDPDVREAVETALELEGGRGGRGVAGLVRARESAMMWIAWLSWRSAPRGSRWRLVLPELAGIGAVAVWRAKPASVGKRLALAVWPMMIAAVTGPQPCSASRAGQ